MVLQKADRNFTAFDPPQKTACRRTCSSTAGLFKNSLFHRKTVDVVLGFNDLKQYEQKNPFFGSFISRNVDRIAGAEIFIDGKKVRLTPNESEAQQHGGTAGFGTKNWDYEVENEKLTLKYLSPDREEGYPVKLQVEASFK